MLNFKACEEKETIWKKKFEIKDLNLFIKDSILENVGIEFLEKGNDFISAKPLEVTFFNT